MLCCLQQVPGRLLFKEKEKVGGRKTLSKTRHLCFIGDIQSHFITESLSPPSLFFPLPGLHPGQTFYHWAMYPQPRCLLFCPNTERLWLSHCHPYNHQDLKTRIKQEKSYPVEVYWSGREFYLKWFLQVLFHSQYNLSNRRNN